MTGPVAHRPVMLAEVLAALAPKGGAVYVDATFGAGGYAAALLEAASCRVVAMDRDPEACARGAELAERFAGRLSVLRGRFSEMVSVLERSGVSRVDGVAFDLGVSSMQLDRPERGFSFRDDGPLDMRMDPDETLSAADLVNRLDERELAHILFVYGEERASRRIARAVVEARKAAPILSTRQLADVVRRVLPPAKDGLDPATRTFQALRIQVNDEMGELCRGLRAAEHVLVPGGRLCVVSFHSLEDRKVKNFLRERSGAAPRTYRQWPDSPATERPPSFRLLHRRPLRPSAAEIAENPRARSARLRAAERTHQPAWPAAPGQRRAA